jgi:hypothetical protein
MQVVTRVRALALACVGLFVIAACGGGGSSDSSNKPKAQASIGKGSTIAAGTIIGYRVHVGRDCYIGPNATLTHTLIGNRVIIHNIRNCDYRTETDFDVHYYERTFDLGDLAELICPLRPVDFLDIDNVADRQDAGGLGSHRSATGLGSPPKH